MTTLTQKQIFDIIQDANEEQFDRQLRIWGSIGQANLRSSFVLLFSSSLEIVEAMRNLVLPDLKQICIIDDAITSQHDINTNFFIDPDDLGVPRANAILHGMKQLNPHFLGSA